MEDWGYDFGGLNRKEVMGCVTHHGNAYTDKQGLHLDGMISFGDMCGQINQMEVMFNKPDETELQILFDVKGYMNYRAISIKNNTATYICKNDGVINSQKIECENSLNHKIALKTERKHGLIIMYCENALIEFKDENLCLQTGAAGFMADEANNCIILGCKLEHSNFQ